MPKAKKSSKANTPSWRTMLRQATALEKLERGLKQDKNTPARVRLRKDAAALREQANLKHRSERKAKGLKASVKRGGAKRRRAAAIEALATIANQINPDQGLVQTGWQAVERPGHGEIVGGEMSRLADEIVALARKKSGTDQIQSKLTMATATARYMGEREADQRHRKQLIEVNDAFRDKIVCGFIAEMEDMMGQKGGIPPEQVFAYNGFTLCRIIDVLNNAGYTAKGKR